MHLQGLAFLVLVPVSLSILCSKQLIYLSDGETGAMFCLQEGKYTCEMDAGVETDVSDMRVVNVTTHTLLQMKKSCQIETVRRRKRESWFFNRMYEGTKWCGEGSDTSSYNDLGNLEETDACCRDHDQGCGDDLEMVLPFTCLSNSVCTLVRQTRHHCDCDDFFKQCLNNVIESESASADDKTAAESVGQMYFNSIGQTCYISEIYRKTSYDINYNPHYANATKHVWKESPAFP